MAVKKRDHEKLTDSNIANVIKLLEADKPITKKDACEILNISYNTARLGKILETWKERQKYEEKRRAANRGKSATTAEISTIIKEYLDGEPAIGIAKQLYRSTTFVNSIVEKVGIPKRESGDDKFKVAFLPEACVSEDFIVGEIAWSAKHHAPCIVKEKLSNMYNKKYGTNCYNIYVSETVEESSPYFPQVEIGGFNAYVPSYDIGKLTHLKQYGVAL